MSLKTHAKHLYVSIFAITLSACYSPPYNNFENDHRLFKEAAIGAGIGAGTGAIVGSIVGGGSGAVGGAVIGTVAGASIGVLKNTRSTLIREIQNCDMQLIHYGDTMTLIIPTDQFYLINSPHLNDRAYIGLAAVVRLLRHYPYSPIYVAAFSDDVGSRHHKKMLTQAQAETMLTFLWANDVHAQRLQAEGYGDKHDIGDNHWIRGSAYNRRIEIQWLLPPKKESKPVPYVYAQR